MLTIRRSLAFACRALLILRRRFSASGSEEFSPIPNHRARGLLGEVDGLAPNPCSSSAVAVLPSLGEEMP